MLSIKVALVDDSEFYLRLLSSQLALRQVDARCYTDTDDFFKEMENTDWRPDVYVLDYDFGIDRPSGIDVMTKLHERHPAPIIMLTGIPLETIENLRLRSYYAGAVNFMTKPCDMNELYAIIHNLSSLNKLLIRDTRAKNSRPVLQIDHQCRYEVFSRTIICDGNATSKLTEKESSLLEILLINKNSLVDRDRVYKHIYGQEMHPLNRSIDNLACRLRNKLNEVCNDVVIVNHRSHGYRLYSH
jgi:DNA-binding response OmpR family regulator